MVSLLLPLETSSTSLIYRYCVKVGGGHTLVGNAADVAVSLDMFILVTDGDLQLSVVAGVEEFRALVG